MQSVKILVMEDGKDLWFGCGNDSTKMVVNADKVG